MRAFCLLCLLCLSSFAQAAPKSEPWALWTAHDDANTATIDHAPFDRLLTEYVKPSADGINRVGYSRFSAANKAALASYVEQLQALPISRYSRAEQRAYWINLYNAKTVQLVVGKYPIASIRDIILAAG